MSIKKPLISKVNSLPKEKNEVKSDELSNLIEERISFIEKKLDALIACLNKNSSVTAHCPKNSEGKREIQL